MATILSKPDELSLSGNLKPFKVSTSESLNFTLSVGTEILVNETYHPSDGIVEVDVKDVVISALSFVLQYNTSYVQPSIIRMFVASIDGVDYSFRAIRTGISNLADTPSNWLKENFLTWQPKLKKVTYYTPEWITYFAVIACDIKVKAYFTNNTSEAVTLQSCSAGNAYTINMQYAVVSGLFSGKKPMYYEVAAYSGSSQLSYIQKYVVSDQISEDEQWILFENSLGGIDTFRAFGVTDFSGEHSYNRSIIDDVMEEYLIDTERLYTKNTGHLNKYERRWLLDFFPSRAKYIYQESAIHKIAVKESDVAYKSSDLPSSYTFTYCFADISPYLNLIRNEDELPANISIPVPDAPNFTIPPRLAEFPRVLLREGVVFPAFDPNSSEVTVTTFGAIKSVIIEEVLASITFNPGGGGSGVTIIKENDTDIEPTDLNVFSSLKTIKEIYNAIQENLVDIDGAFLRKDIDDTAHGIISFEKGFKSPVYVAGFDEESIGFCLTPAGEATLNSLNVRTNLFMQGRLGTPAFASGFLGWGVDVNMETSSAEFDYLMVRKEFRVNTLVVNQTLGLNGSTLVTDFNKMASVEELADRYRCTIDKVDDMMYMNIRANDVVRCQQFDGISSKYYFGFVIGITSDYFDIAKPLLDGISIPSSGDIAFRFGNTTDSNRQGLIYLTTSDTYAPYIDILDGMTSKDLAGKTKVRLGRLDGLRGIHAGQLAGHGIYIKGGIFEESEYYLADGSTVTQTFSIVNGTLNSLIASDTGFETRITQNTNSIGLLAGRVTQNENSIITANSKFTVTADWISALVNKVTTVEGRASTIESSGYITSATAQNWFVLQDNFNSLAQRVSSAESNILMTANSISAVNTSMGLFNGRIISLESAGFITTSTAASIYATKTEYNLLGDRVSSSESRITAAESAINLKVSTTNYNGVSVVSMINQTASDILISASKVAFNAYNQNLVRNSGNYKNTNYWSYTGLINSIQIISSGGALKFITSGSGNIYNRSLSGVKLWSGRKYTLRISVYSSVSQSVSFTINDTYTKTQSLVASDQEVIWKFTTSSDLDAGFFKIQSSTSCTLHINWLKLEEGDYATSWSPHPSDSIYSLDSDLVAALNGTTISGGLQLTTKIKLGLLSGGVWTEQAGISANIDNIMLWSGGTYVHAVAGTAKTILYHDGSGKYTGKLESRSDGDRIVIDPSEKSMLMYSDSFNMLKLGWDETSTSAIKYPSLTLNESYNGSKRYNTYASPSGLSVKNADTQLFKLGVGGMYFNLDSTLAIMPNSTNLIRGTVWYDGNGFLKVKL